MTIDIEDNATSPASRNTDEQTVGHATLAHYLGISPSSLQRMRRLGQMPIPPVPGGGRPRFAKQQIAKWLAAPHGPEPVSPSEWRLLTVAQAGAILGWSRATTYRRLQASSSPVDSIPMGLESRVPLCRIRFLLDRECSTFPSGDKSTQASDEERRSNR